MIIYTQGDLLESQTEALVNAVNCVGVMGKGIAKQFKIKFPDNFDAYYRAYKNHRLGIGKIFVYKISEENSPKYILNFPTKKHWKDNSYSTDVIQGLFALKQIIINLNIQSISIPALGCGLGGLRWITVKRYIEEILGNLDSVEILVFEPNETIPYRI